MNGLASSCAELVQKLATSAEREATHPQKGWSICAKALHATKTFYLERAGGHIGSCAVEAHFPFVAQSRLVPRSLQPKRAEFK